MALSETEKVKVLRHLGWPAKTLDSTSLSYSKMISDRLANVSAVMEAEVRQYLERIAILDDRLTKALSRAGVKRIDDIEFNGDEMPTLRKEKRRLVIELATLLDIGVQGGGMMGNVCV